MKRKVSYLCMAGIALVATTACQDSTAVSATMNDAALAASLSSVPVGFGDLTSSYVGIAANDAAMAGLWLGGGREASFARDGLMGGGLAESFSGGIGFGGGKGGHHGPFGGGLSCTGTFDAATSRVVCADVTANGLTISRSARYTTAAGTVQQAFDTLTTNTVNIASKTSGTIAFTRATDSSSAGDRGKDHWGRGRGPGGRLLGDTSTILTASTTVNSTSNRTTSGLASGSTQRMVNGTSSGTESTTGTSTRGSFVASRTVGDTTTGLIVPVTTGSTSYPTAGSVVRSIRASLAYTGSAAVTLTRREVITYDGTATAKVVITENGVTKSCTRPLPRGPLTCS